MGTCKEDLHQLIAKVNDSDAKLIYNLIRVIIEKDDEKNKIVKTESSPLTEYKKIILKQVEIENDDLIDWDNLLHC